MKARKKVAHGIDHLRYEQMKQLWSPYSDDPIVGEFRRIFTEIINKIIQAQIPSGITSIFKDIELLALPKGDDDIRPIGLQLILKKIACSICLKRTRAFNTAYFKNLQYCMSPFGTESVSLFFRAILESNPELDLWSKDGENGFGRLSRISGLYETKQKFPELLPILRMVYGSSANAWYMGLDEGIESVKSSEGCVSRAMFYRCGFTRWLFILSFKRSEMYLGIKDFQNGMLMMGTQQLLSTKWLKSSVL